MTVMLTNSFPLLNGPYSDKTNTVKQPTRAKKVKKTKKK